MRKSLAELLYPRHQMISVAISATSNDNDDDDQYDDVQGQILGRVAVSASSDDQPHSLNSDSVRSDRIFSTFDKVRGGGFVKLAGEEEQADISKGCLKKKTFKDISNNSYQLDAKNIIENFEPVQAIPNDELWIYIQIATLIF